MERFERLFEVLGWVGFALLTPAALHVFQVAPVVQTMEQGMGFAGKPGFWVLAGFALILLRILFGGEHTILPLFLGFAVGFLFLSLATEIGFMGWFRRPAETQFFFAEDKLTFAVGAAVLFFGLMLCYFRKVSVLLQLLLLILLPMLVLMSVNFIVLRAA